MQAAAGGEGAWRGAAAGSASGHGAGSGEPGQPEGRASSGVRPRGPCSGQFAPDEHSLLPECTVLKKLVAWLEKYRMNKDLLQINYQD